MNIAICESDWITLVTKQLIIAELNHHHLLWVFACGALVMIV
jgi:hypothetical protein